MIHDVELQSISDLVAETEEALEISQMLHEILVKEIRAMRASVVDRMEASAGL